MTTNYRYEKDIESLENDSAICSNDDNRAVKYGLCEVCLDNLTDCPCCKEKALDDGVICHYCGQVFAHVGKTLFATIESTDGSLSKGVKDKYLQIEQKETELILTFSNEDQFYTELRYLSDFDVTEVFKAVIEYGKILTKQYET